ncbi:MAG: FKBP-type peptidyl-prolyl cis-trans isomerase [Bacteroidales bacterium]|nr:FKBP-type peptidyl-prolyl cis-trans isomerase [Bacteroidales bacterium]MBR5027671.1 FKBP-type peptidyl-prolyl cis-trans isomerase [Bacteroidales bacterium]
MNRFLVITLVALTLAACGGRDIPVIETETKPDIKENMINANRYMSNAEETQIDELVRRNGWNATKLNNGVRVWEYQKGTGEKLSYEMRIKIRYSLSAISLATIYDNVEKEITVGKSEVVPGLDTGLMELRRGSKAKIIVPAYAGYGVAGDGDKVPQNATLIFDVEIN